MYIIIGYTDEGWRDIEVIHGKLCKKILGLSGFATKGFAGLEL
jgi:hypothetical protein